VPRVVDLRRHLFLGASRFYERAKLEELETSHADPPEPGPIPAPDSERDLDWLAAHEELWSRRKSDAAAAIGAHETASPREGEGDAVNTRNVVELRDLIDAWQRLSGREGCPSSWRAVACLRLRH
jgi:hypothetical protein